MSFPGGKVAKNPRANAGNAEVMQIPPPGVGMAPTPAVLLGKPHGQRSLVGCSPWGSQRVGRG